MNILSAFAHSTASKMYVFTYFKGRWQTPYYEDENEPKATKYKGSKRGGLQEKERGGAASSYWKKK